MTRLGKRIGIIVLVGVATLGGWYGVVAYRYWNNPPKLSRNFTAELNAPILAIPESERAWPVYRDVMTKLHRTAPDATLRIRDCRYVPFAVPDRTKGARFIRDQRKLLDRALEATRRRTLGQILSDGSTREDIVFGTRSGDDSIRSEMEKRAPTTASDNPMLFHVLLPAVDSKELFDLLIADACLAARDGDGLRMTRNLSALMRMAAQFRETPILVDDLCSAARFDDVLRTWGHLMRASPELFDDAPLTQLENLARSYADGAIGVRLEGERAMFQDIVQRCYADDGCGDAYFYLAGLDPDLGGTGDLSWPMKLTAPLTTDRFLSRNELLGEYERIMKIAEPELQRPLWQCTDWLFRKEARGHQGDARYQLIALLVGGFEHAHSAFQRTTEYRDAVLAASTLLRYRRKTGDWPQKLDDLVPRYLPELPLDRRSGRPLLYRRGPAGPILYTTGHDGMDDGGTPARLPAEGGSPGDLSYKPQRDWYWEPAADGVPPTDGDRILWPVVSPEELEQGKGWVEASPP